MAYLIESLISKKTNPPTVPYRIVELIAKETLPNVKWTKAMFVALCEISLQSYNPPHIFIDILHRMKEQSFIPNSVTCIYNFCDSYSIDNQTVSEFAEDLLNDISKHLFNFFGSPALLDTLNWIKNIVHYSKKCFTNNFSFSLLIENKSSSEIIKKFGVIIKEVGFPLMSNNKEQYWADVDNQISFKAILESYKILTLSDYSSCGLYTYCTQGEDITTCENCKKAPWKRVKEGKICPLTMIWKIWGINDIEFEKNHS
ncbi:MAG: hypothetical protein ACRBFS_26465 [Aureispira sp.]